MLDVESEGSVGRNHPWTSKGCERLCIERRQQSGWTGYIGAGVFCVMVLCPFDCVSLIFKLFSWFCCVSECQSWTPKSWL